MATHPTHATRPPAERYDLTPAEFHLVETWQPGAGDLLKRWRESRGLTRTSVAAKCMCSSNLIGYWESQNKKPSGQRMELLCALLCPKNLARVRDKGFVKSDDLDNLVHQLEAAHESPIEQQYFILAANINKILVCLIMKATGTVMAGVDTRAAMALREWYVQVKREYELSLRQSGQKLSKRGAQWLKHSMSSETHVSPEVQPTNVSPLTTDPTVATSNVEPISSDDVYATVQPCLPGSSSCVPGLPHQCGAQGLA